MGYWKTKVLPKIKKVFEKDTTKKVAATEATKSFDDSKEDITKEFDDKKAELTPKVIEIYEASTTEIKALIKEPKEAGLKKHSTAVTKFLQKLAEIDFPGSKAVSEASSKVGPALIPGPVFFVFEKVSTFIVVEEKEAEPPAAAAPEPSAEESTSKDKDIVIEEDKKEEVVIAPEPVAPAEPPPKAEEPEATPPPKP